MSTSKFKAAGASLLNSDKKVCADVGFYNAILVRSKSEPADEALKRSSGHREFISTKKINSLQIMKLSSPPLPLLSFGHTALTKVQPIQKNILNQATVAVRSCKASVRSYLRALRAVEMEQWEATGGDFLRSSVQRSEEKPDQNPVESCKPTLLFERANSHDTH